MTTNGLYSHAKQEFRFHANHDYTGLLLCVCGACRFLLRRRQMSIGVDVEYHYAQG